MRGSAQDISQVRFLNAVLFRIACQEEGQSAVAGDVAGGSEGILQGKDGQHQSRAGLIESQDAGDQAQGSHNGTAGNAGCTDGENAQQQAEEDHLAGGGEGAVEHPGNGHDEEGLGHDGAAQMNVGKKRNTEVDQVVPQGGLGLSGAFKGYGKGSRAGHGAHGRHVGGAVVLYDVHGVSSGIGPCDAVEQSQPDIVADHDDHDDDQEDGQLLGDGAFIGQGAEGAADQHGQDRNDELCNDAQNDLLELLQDAGDLIR